MDARRFRHFVVLAEELHFGRAAERLGISQPPLSLQIRTLEEELGAILFDRTSRRVTLTEPGKAFLVEARAALNQIDHAVATARRAQRGEFGELKVGMTTTVPLMGYVPKILREFRNRYSDVHLTLVEMLSENQGRAIDEGRLHIAFLRLPSSTRVSQSSVEAMALGDDDLAVFMPESYPLAHSAGEISLAELADYPFVFYEPYVPTVLHESVRAICQEAGFVPKLAQEASEPATLLGLVAANFGWTIMPASYGRMMIDGTVCRPLTQVREKITTWMIYPKAHSSPLIGAFVDLAARLYRQPPPS
ncbi:MAG: LysR substrate-binding domain-containing protein [Sphingomonas sp.]